MRRRLRQDSLLLLGLSTQVGGRVLEAIWTVCRHCVPKPRREKTHADIQFCLFLSLLSSHSPQTQPGVGMAAKHCLVVVEGEGGVAVSAAVITEMSQGESTTFPSPYIMAHASQ